MKDETDIPLLEAEWAPVVSTSGRGMNFCSMQERPFKRGSCTEVEMAACHGVDRRLKE